MNDEDWGREAVKFWLAHIVRTTVAELERIAAQLREAM